MGRPYGRPRARSGRRSQHRDSPASTNRAACGGPASGRESGCRQDGPSRRGPPRSRRRWALLVEAPLVADADGVGVVVAGVCADHLFGAAEVELAVAGDVVVVAAALPATGLVHLVEHPQRQVLVGAARRAVNDNQVYTSHFLFTVYFLFLFTVCSLQFLRPFSSKRAELERTDDYIIRVMWVTATYG